ncbi:MAG: prepilin-type N-terminal cleavage/methylation domain-containing protein [Nitrospinae bacterium]|nr:prepilin-type N-terminal cleavage/methylation domain-containing protein [Nitrospinota bacterium]
MKRIATDNDGFTLMELIVVVAIIGIAAAVAIPTLMSELPKFKVNGAVRNLASDMQWAKMKAVAENNEFVMKFDMTENCNKDKYWIYDDNGSDGVTLTCSNGDLVPTDTTKETLVKTGVLPTGIKFGRALAGIKRTSCPDTIDTDGIHLPSGGSILTFQTNGLPSGTGGSVYLIPSQDDENNAQRTDRWRAISVSSTGRIKGWKYELSAQNCGNSQGPWSPL